ncbi:hypothetical protein H9636_10210 [Ureibacillus sp. Re31]|uniref:Uncharacterized protein n=1 Tax=Ureibacillus galli TaxID=2762222 RepID=A0ABR8XCT1_9BACL|nr:hypothetical protein [Ureibacillus galli]MBD8027028.1 hypothetical protein [Ureibacillus galli]
MFKLFFMFLKYFVCFFIGCILFNLIVKGEWLILTAFSCSLGVALGISLFQYYLTKEVSQS